MKVIINIPEKFVNAAEQISILGGEDYKEFLKKAMKTKKTIQIEIPDGKRAEWVDGVLTLVDEQPQESNY